MSVPPSFQFSQSSLNDYADCPRRFQLRYLLEQAWPAVESEPLIERERLADLGRRFHRLIQQHVHGLPDESLARAADADPDLARWWASFQRFARGGWILGADGEPLPPERRAEVALSIPFGAHRLVAKYDLLAAGGGRAVIVDWKTERRRPDRAELARRLQTRVYRYVLARARPSIAPQSIAMVYWFAEHPGDPEILAYDAVQFARDENELAGLLSEIEGQAGDVWPLTPDERKCRFCAYRSLCDRGVSAGVADAVETDFDLDVDLAEIDEIAY